MNLPYEFRIGLRYTRAGRRARRRNGFISFISAISMAGIALGVAALIVVLSVMNGFTKEVRDRMLSVLSHIEVSAFNGPLPDWRRVAEQAQKNPAVQVVAVIARGVAGDGAVGRYAVGDADAGIADGAHRVGHLAGQGHGDLVE